MLTSHSRARAWGTVAAEVVAATTFLVDRISQMLDSGFWTLTSCTVSYTPLTLPTNSKVSYTVGDGSLKK